MMSCSCFCCRTPRYKRLVDALYPEDPQDVSPVASNLDKLLYFASASPEHLDRVGEYLAQRLRRSLTRERRGHVCVSLKIMERLVAECDAQRLELITSSYLDMLQTMLEADNSDFQILAADSFVVFSEREEQTTPYHRQYDFFIHRFAAMSLEKDTSSQQLFKQTRQAGLRGLRGVIKKTEGDEQLNIWEPDDMNKIVPPFLFNMQLDTTLNPTQVLSPGTQGSLALYAEDGLKELVVSAGLAHTDSVILPVLQHFDLNKLWTQEKDFASRVFVTIIESMQKQHRYRGIQSLVAHLDANANESSDLKQGILDTLTKCVAVAADGSLGPSVLDVFRTLVKHLRISIENEPHSLEASVTSAFQQSITRTMGEFAGILPDYHKPDIMSLITSYMAPTDMEREGGERKEGSQKASAREGCPVLTASLVKCMKTIANTYQPEVLETTFPETLFSSLVQLLMVDEHNTQLDICLLWHQLIDHHKNKPHLPLHTKWESLESAGLTLGKVSQRFIAQNKTTLYRNLSHHALNLSTNTDNLVSFYVLLGLLALEFAQPGVLDMTHFLRKLQDTALDPAVAITREHRMALHAIIAGILFLLGKISSTASLEQHVCEVVEQRRETATILLPDTLFADNVDTEDGGLPAENDSIEISDDLLFHLTDRGLDQLSPEPAENRRAAFLMREYSTHSSDFQPHASLSLDCGLESPMSADPITFTSLKEDSLLVQPEEGAVRKKFGFSITYEQQVGLSSKSESMFTDIKQLITPTNYAKGDVATSAYDLEIPSLNNGL